MLTSTVASLFVAGALSTEQRTESGTYLGVVVRHAPGRQQEDGLAMRGTRRPSLTTRLAGSLRTHTLAFSNTSNN